MPEERFTTAKATEDTIDYQERRRKKLGRKRPHAATISARRHVEATATTAPCTTRSQRRLWHKGRAPHQRRRPRADNTTQRWGEYNGRLRRHVRRRRPNGRRTYQADAGGGKPPPSILGSTNATSANRRQRDHKSLSSSRATDHRTRARSLLRTISSGRPRTEQRAPYHTATNRRRPPYVFAERTGKSSVHASLSGESATLYCACSAPAEPVESLRSQLHKPLAAQASRLEPR